jgi:hypothetical protein
MKKLVFILSAFFLMSIVVRAQKPEVITDNKAGWHKIGSTKVNFKTDKDEFLILGKDRFKAIQVKVKDAPVRIENMEIQYEGGQKEDVSIGSELKAGTDSRIINLRNNSAELKKVEFVYKTVTNSKDEKAEIELWGLK